MEKDGSVGSSGLELARVRAGEGAVQVGETASRASGGVEASPKCPGANGGDEGGGCEDEVDRRACIQGFPATAQLDELQLLFFRLGCCARQTGDKCSDDAAVSARAKKRA